MVRFTRRDFLKTGVAATVLSGIGSVAGLAQTKRSATDWVTLGKSKVKVTRLAFGTGTFGGRVQRELGQEEFTSLVRYAYDRGIRFFETAESYHGMPEMLAIALKGLPRDSYRLMTKYSTPASGDPAPKIDSVPPAAGYRIHRHSAAALPAAAHMVRGLRESAGRILRSQAEEDHPVARRFGSRPAGAAHLPRQSVAGNRHDPHEPQRHQNGHAGHAATCQDRATWTKWWRTPRRCMPRAWASSA